jgi:oxalate decarboxylase/phosphoglucose isomerase-like protein (cupin superfamily)
MLIAPENTPTVVLDWGTLKWFVTPDTVTGAESTFGEVIVYPGRGHAPHIHQDAQKVIYVIAGEAEQTVGYGASFPLRAGDSVFIPRGTIHSTYLLRPTANCITW